MPRNSGSSVRLDTAVRTFFEALEKEKLAPDTLKSKQRTMRYLVKAAGGPHRMTRRLGNEHFEACLRDLVNGASEAETLWRKQNGKGLRRGRRASSLKQDYAVLNQFVGWLKHNDWVKASFDPMYRITKSAKDNPDVPKDRVYRGRKVPIEQWPDLLNATTNPRDRMIVAVGLFWGCRASSTVKIQIKHLDLDNKTVGLFNEKRGRWYLGEPRKIIAPMQRELEGYLAWYVSRYGELQPDWYLVPNKVPGYICGRYYTPEDWPVTPTQPMHTRTATRVAKDALRGIGWTDDMFIHEGAHTLRRSGGTEAQRRAGLDGMMSFLDDTDANSAIRYSQNAPGREKLEEAMDKLVLPGQRQPDTAPAEVEPEPGQLAEVINLFSRRRVG